MVVTGAFADGMRGSGEFRPDHLLPYFLCALLAGFAFFALNWLTRGRLLRPKMRRLDELMPRIPFPVAAPAQSDRRTSPRRGGFYVKVVVADGEDDAEPMLAKVKNRSKGGLCLSVTSPVDVGTILSVRATRTSETTPWVTVRVRRSRQRKDHWEIGCQFEGEYCWATLAQFG
jgi:hypothetical protein